MRRVIVGWILIVHALAHVSADVWTSVSDPLWFTTILCTIAFVGYFSTGLALFRMPVARDHWKALLLSATLASLTFIVWTRPAWGMIGAALDIALFLLVIDVMQPTWLGFVLAPVNALVFEPMHFIMERGMLRGIRARAERLS